MIAAGAFMSGLVIGWVWGALWQRNRTVRALRGGL
jgi:hypothetical protein